MITLEPQGLVKKLVGESLNVQVHLNPKLEYEVELYTNINGEKGVYPFEREGNAHRVKVFLTKSGLFSYSVRFKKKGTKTWFFLKDKYARKLINQVHVDPAWLSHAVAYCVFVRFFKGTVGTDLEKQPDVIRDGTYDQELLKSKKLLDKASLHAGEGGTFDDVKAHLDTLKKMDINMLYFNPIHMIGEIYRGYNMLDQLPPYLQPGSPYSVKDYKSIDPELTYDRDSKRFLLADPAQEFKELINAAHERGMFIIMDMVFNHTAHDFVLQRIRPEWYLYKETIDSLDEPYLYPEDVKEGKPWGDPRHSMAPFDHGVWWTDCAQLNWEHMLPEGPNDPPPNYTIKEMWEYFKAIPQFWIKHFGVDGFRADVAYRVPTAFWKACISEAREFAKDIKSNLANDVIFIGESYTNNLAQLHEAGFSAVYGDFCHKLNKPIQLKGYLDYIYNIGGHYFPEGSRWFHFPDSHDFERGVVKVLGEKPTNMQVALLANQSRWLLTATLPGIPLVFNGFEKVEWQPINIWSYGAIDWEKEIDLREYIAKINRIRKRLVPLQKGTYRFLDTNQGLNDETQLFAYIRQFKEDSVIVIVNMDVYNQAGPAEVYLPPEFSGRYQLLDHMTQKKYEREGRVLTVVLEAGQGHIFEVLKRD